MRLDRSVGLRWSAAAVLAAFSFAASGCTIEGRVGGPVEPINWHPWSGSGGSRPVPAPAPMPNVPPPQPQQPQAPQNPPRRIAHIPKPNPVGGTVNVPVAIARNNGLFGGPND